MVNINDLKEGDILTDNLSGNKVFVDHSLTPEEYGDGYGKLVVTMYHPLIAKFTQLEYTPNQKGFIPRLRQ